jgi:hypothetical protein
MIQNYARKFFTNKLTLGSLKFPIAVQYIIEGSGAGAAKAAKAPSNNYPLVELRCTN